MSLPSELVNRPAPAASHPAVIGGLWRIVLRASLILLPFVVHAAMQVPGTSWQRDSTQLQEAIDRERHERRRLLAERAALLDPARLRREARRLGLVPSIPGSDTLELPPAARRTNR